MSYLAEWPAVLQAWLAAAAAWTAVQILPLGLKVLDDYRLRYRRSVLVARREALIAEWGLEDEPAGVTPPGGSDRAPRRHGPRQHRRLALPTTWVV